MSDNEESRFYRDLLRAYIDSANDAIFVLCDEMKFLACNRVMQDWLGQYEQDLIRHNARIPITDFLGNEEAGAVLRHHFPAALAGQKPRFEMRMVGPSGISRWVEMSLSRVNIEAGDMVMAVARDITERRQQEFRVQHHATHDALTGLPNRAWFLDMLATALEWSEQSALLVLDLNHFRDLNDHLGHAMGDLVLRTTAERITRIAGASPHARVGSNEFTLWLPGMSAEEASSMAERLHDALTEAVASDLGDHRIDLTIGIALQPLHARTAVTLLQNAESAMYRARGQRRNIALFDPTENQHNANRLRILGELRRAIESGALDVHYQPIVSLHDNTKRRVEALVRWHRPGQEQIGPADFIPLSEYTGGIHQLTRQIVHQALADCAPLIHEGRLESLSVNLSPLCLGDATLPASLAAMLVPHTLPTGALVLEITENAIMDDMQLALRALEALRAQGIELAVDDFGMGHSSLAKLRQLPVSELKIDRSFVSTMHRNDGDSAIVRASLQLARTFGCRVVAEGIDSPEVFSRLVEYGCDYGQGYLIARPMSRADLVAWLERSSH